MRGGWPGKVRGRTTEKDYGGEKNMCRGPVLTSQRHFTTFATVSKAKEHSQMRFLATTQARDQKHSPPPPWRKLTTKNIRGVVDMTKRNGRRPKTCMKGGLQDT